MKKIIPIFILFMLIYISLVSGATITLRTPETENLEDTQALNTTGGLLDSGANTQMCAGNQGTGSFLSYIKFYFDASAYGDITITDAKLFLYQTDGNQEGRWNAGRNFTIYQISNQTWNENSCRGHPTLFPCPSSGSVITSVDVSTFSALDGAWTNFTVTSWVNNNSVTNSQKNLSFMIYFPTTTSGMYHCFATKENASTSYIPYLEITYTNSITSLQIVHPSALQSLSYNTSIGLNYTFVNNSAVGSCWYNLDGGTNITISNCANTTFNTSEGEHTVNLFINDTVGFTLSDSHTFYVTLNAPSINLNYPSNQQYFNTNRNIYLNYTATDGNGLSVCQIWHNLTGTWHLNQTNTGVTSGAMNFTIVNSSADGVYKWNVWCNDTTGQGGFSPNNFTFITDTTFPVILESNVNITLATGSQDVSFNVTSYTEVNCNDSFYSVLNIDGSINNGLENISLSCSDLNSSFTVSGTPPTTYTLRVYMNDKSGNENYTDISFSTIASPSAPAGGGGGGTTIIQQISAVLSQNFSITSGTLGNRLDVVLAKGSVRPREKSFVIINKAKDVLRVKLICDTEDLDSNQTRDIVQGVNICDYVSFDNEVVDVSANEDNPTTGKVYVQVPENASFGDNYAFNILAVRELETNGSTTYSKLSVSARTPLWGLVYKYSYIPLQQSKDPARASYPVILVTIFLSFLIFAFVLLALRKQFLITGFILGVLGFAISFGLLIYFL